MKFCSSCLVSIISSRKRKCEYCLSVSKPTNSRKDIRTKILSQYGNKCLVCGEDYIGFLKICRIDTNLPVGLYLYKYLEENNYPPIVEILCAICLSKKSELTYLPLDDVQLMTSGFLYEKKIKAYRKYGSKCVCCGRKNFLEFDHVYNNGKEHREYLNGHIIYLWAEEHGYPESLQLLCKNCHNAKTVLGSCTKEHPCLNKQGCSS